MCKHENVFAVGTRVYCANCGTVIQPKTQEKNQTPKTAKGVKQAVKQPNDVKPIVNKAVDTSKQSSQASVAAVKDMQEKPASKAESQRAESETKTAEIKTKTASTQDVNKE